MQRRINTMSRQEKNAIRPDAQPARSWTPSAVVLFILVVTCMVELALIASDHGLIGSTRWRGLAYQNGAFWSGLLDNWRPNYPVQPYLMFVTYPFLHSDLWHLLGNMIVLFLMGRILVPRVGPIWFAVIYFVSGVGGGLGFALLGDTAQPMVGASGALFGLVGAWKWQDWFLYAQNGYSRRALVMDVFILILLNFLMWFMQDGQLAWEAHLGGFLTGWLVATLLIPRHDLNKI
jgi:membrane associated rhomboid family serine protease